MSPVHASRILLIGFSGITLSLLVWVVGPFGDHKDSGGLILSLILLPFLAIWAVGPYVIGHKFAGEHGSSAAWAYPALHIVSGVAALWFYADVLVINPAADLNALWEFVSVPVFQFIAVVAVYYVLRAEQQEP